MKVLSNFSNYIDYNANSHQSDQMIISKCNEISDLSCTQNLRRQVEQYSTLSAWSTRPSAVQMPPLV